MKESKSKEQKIVAVTDGGSCSGRTDICGVSIAEVEAERVRLYGRDTMAKAPGGRELTLFVPEYGNYYHFMTESMMGLYRELSKAGALESKNCKIWYKGRYTPIIQLLSCHPVHNIDILSEVPNQVRTLDHVRPKNPLQWAELILLRDYLDRIIATIEQKCGITVIRRIGKREYAQHEDLMNELKCFELPLREAVMEDLSIEEQVSLMRSTRFLIAPHGAGLTNMMFMQRGGKILELYPKGFSDRCFPAMSTVFGHQHVELEALSASVLKREPSDRVRRYLANNPWPTREIFAKWKPDQMELGRVLRDVASFSIDVKAVIDQVDRMLSFP